MGRARQAVNNDTNVGVASARKRLRLAFPGDSRALPSLACRLQRPGRGICCGQQKDAHEDADLGAEETK